MPSEVRNWCWTCRRALSPAWWDRHIQSIGHVRRALGDPLPFVQPKARDADEDEPEDDVTSLTSTDYGDVGGPDTRPWCGGCSKGIMPGSEYWRDNGLAYHNNCVPLATTRPLNPTQAAQAAPQQAAALVAGVGVQLGAGKGEKAPSPTPASDDQGKPERPLARLARERREARTRNG